jgi:hypothetical protein
LVTVQPNYPTYLAGEADPAYLCFFSEQNRMFFLFNAKKKQDVQDRLRRQDRQDKIESGE